VSFLDDYIDALLRAFRADEARMDDAIRSRIWAEITDADPEAADWLDTLDRGARVRQIRRQAPRPSQILAVAAVLVLLAAVQLVVHSGPSEEPFVSTGPSTTLPIPHDLDEFADRVAIMQATVLGETDETRYSYLRGVRTGQIDPTLEVETSFEQRWVAVDGSGRDVNTSDATGRDETTGGPGTYDLGLVPPRAAVHLDDDVDMVLATVGDHPEAVSSGEHAAALVDLLTYAGLPGPARAGVLRALDQLGFEPAPGPDPAPSLWRVEGPGPDGSTMRVDFDLDTGGVAAWTRLLRGGGFIRFTDIEVGLRRDTQSS
jgi:hypothetical protein